jgi:hypothetical protein
MLAKEMAVELCGSSSAGFVEVSMGFAAISTGFVVVPTGFVTVSGSTSSSSQPPGTNGR